MKYRIVTRPGICFDVLYSVQSSRSGIFWKEENFFVELNAAKDYMNRRIKKRDFKSEVIVSE